MQGSILYVDQKQGFVQGSDQNRYYFTDADWRGTGIPVAGQNVMFLPDGQNAREVHPLPAQTSSGWGQPNVNLSQLTGQTMPTAGQTKSFLQDFLRFDRMIAPTIITVLYYIYMVGVILGGIALVFSGLFVIPYGGNIVAGYGILVLLFGPLWIRLFAEFMIVIFKIHKRLSNIDENTKA